MSVSGLVKPDYDVLNVVALKKMATAATVAHVTGHSPDEVERVLTCLADRGLVVLAGDAALPTNDAEPALAESAGSHYAGVRGDDDLAKLIDRFEAVNAQFLVTMSSWQQIDVGGRKVINDHSDSEYDEKVIARLEKLTERLRPLLNALAEYDGRFGVYPRRFDAAMHGIDAGRHDLVSSPTEDSVHNIWFEFHEDLLRTLGRERTE
ncbi:hypothetical protein [Pseudonocardia xishanensis]|uniref:Transcriptional regulator n=1 Tax=Pseudonocardia xishanensis TaxID=630995 RepID=A0ABP8RD65_9PSEU